MKKTVYKWKFDSLLQVEHSEHWFSQMAHNGLFIKEMSGFLLHFEKRDPQSLLYKLEFYEERLNQEKLDEYLACGWSYIGASGKMKLFVSANASPCAPPTDVTQRKSALSAMKWQKINALLLTLFSLMLMAYILYLPMSSQRFIESLIKDSVFSFLGLFLLQVIQMYYFIKDINLIQRLLTSTEADSVRPQYFITLPSPTPVAHLSKVIRRISLICFITIAFIFSLTPLFSLLGSKESSLPIHEINLPCVRLKDIEDNAKLLQRRNSPNAMPIDFENYIDFTWSPLAPQIYHIRETSENPKEVWYNSSEVYSPSLATNYYHLAFKELSQPLFNELVHRNMLYESSPMKNVSSSVFDQVSVRVMESNIDIIAYKDNKLFSLKYRGKANLEDLLSQLELVYLRHLLQHIT